MGVLLTVAIASGLSGIFCSGIYFMFCFLSKIEDIAESNSFGIFLLIGALLLAGSLLFGMVGGIVWVFESI